MSASEPKAMADAAPVPGEQTSESRGGPRPGRNALAYLLGRLFRIWVRLLGAAKTGKPSAGAGPVHLVDAADLATAALLCANKAVVCLEPDIASDELTAFLKGCGVRVWRQGIPESAVSPSLDAVVLMPVADTTPARSAYPMAQALLVAAPLERPAAMLTIETVRSVAVRPGGQFDWRIPLAPVGVHHGPASGHLTTAGARLAASRTLTSPAIDAPKSHGVESSGDFEKPTKPLALRFYSGAMRVLEPALVLYLTMRAKRGKEIWDRLSERRGVATVARQPGRLGWIHAASVGESVSILPLASHLLSHGYADRLLVTTGTVTSAALMDLRLPENAHHQFAPLDVPRYVRAFLNHWRPDFALFTESEIWPNLLQGLSQQAIPHALLNGRMSTRSFSRWQRYPNVAHATLQSWSVCLAQTREFATRYAALGVPTVAHTGNLKFDAPPLPADPDILETIR
ncbi:MAG: 3-deoxy-D-manno-octulosonic acid transferase, partial [Hyphomicrobiales bacterium]